MVRMTYKTIFALLLLVGFVGLDAQGRPIREGEKTLGEVLRGRKVMAMSVIKKAAVSKRAQVRAHAVEACERLERGEARGLVFDAIEDEHAGVRFAGAVMVGDLRLADGVGHLAELMKDEKKRQREMRRELSARGLDRMMRRKIMGRYGLSCSVEAACLYGLFVNGVDVNISRMAALLSRDDASLRGNVVMLLGKMGDVSAVPMIREARFRKIEKIEASKQAIVQLQAAEAAAKLLSVEAGATELSIIRANAYSMTPEVRVFAVRVLGDLDDRLVIGALETMLAKETDPQGKVAARLTELQLAAAESLAKMGNQRGLGVALEACAGKNVGDARVGVLWRSYAARVLGEFRGNVRAAGALVALLGDESEDVRLAAAMGILRLGEGLEGF